MNIDGTELDRKIAFHAARAEQFNRPSVEDRFGMVPGTLVSWESPTGTRTGVLVGGTAVGNWAIVWIPAAKLTLKMDPSMLR